MATLLLADAVSWGGAHQDGVSSLLQKPDPLQALPSCKQPPSPCHRLNKSPTSPRCKASKNFVDLLDPPLPQYPHHRVNKESLNPGPRILLDSKPYLDVNITGARTSISVDQESRENSKQPSSPTDTDTAKVAFYADGQELDFRRTQRASPSYLSVSQSRRGLGNAAVIQATHGHLHMKDLKGAPGFYVCFAAIIFGLSAVLQKAGLLGSINPPTTLCLRCYGYGERPCELCKGTGAVTWEGKLQHTDPCPQCFGACVMKCRDCGGFRMRQLHNHARP